jgi:cell division protein FtsA
MSGRSVAVIDLGDTKVVCLVASLVNDEMSVDGVTVTSCKGLRRGEVVEFNAVASSVEISVRRIQQQLGRNITSLFVGIGGPKIDAVQAQGIKPIVPKSRHISHQDVLEVVNHSRAMVLPPDREQIQAVPREFRVDGQRDVGSPVGMTGAKLEAVTTIITADHDQIHTLERIVNSAGKHLDQVILLSMASGLAVLTEDEITNGAAVIDIGGASTEVAIFFAGSLFASFFVPIGGQLVTSDISKVLKTSPDEAERLKMDFGSCIASDLSEDETIDVHELGQPEAVQVSRRMLAEIIESRMRELASMIKQNLSRIGFESSLAGGLVLTGGGSHLNGTESLFRDIFPQMAIRSAEPDLGTKSEYTVGMAASVGLARFALQCRNEMARTDVPSPWATRVRGLFGKG